MLFERAMIGIQTIPDMHSLPFCLHAFHWQSSGGLERKAVEHQYNHLSIHLFKFIAAREKQ